MESFNFLLSKHVFSNLSTKKDQNLPSNLSKTWSLKQAPKQLALKGARFENVNIDKQPNPNPAIDLIAKFPVKEVETNIITCKGGENSLGHPQIFINLVV